jgi:hypothetical protein
MRKLNILVTITVFYLNAWIKPARILHYVKNILYWSAYVYFQDIYAATI